MLKRGNIGDYIGTTAGDIKGGTRSLDHSSYVVFASLQAPRESPPEVPTLDGEADLPPLKTPKALKFLGQKVYLNPKGM